jgi:predicted acylesterase/phospholipase RssA
MQIPQQWTPFPALPQSSLMQYVAVLNPVVGALQVVALTANGGLYTTWQDPGSPGGWVPWQTLSGPPPGISTWTLAAGDTGGQIAVFVLGGDGQVWVASQAVPGPCWSGSWTAIGAPSSDVSNLVFAASAGTNLSVISLFTVGYNDGAVWTTWPDATAASGWAPWVSLGFPGARMYSLTSYCVGSNADGRLEVIALALDGSLWHMWLQPTWTSPSAWQAVRTTGAANGWSLWVQLVPASSGALGPAFGNSLAYPMITNADGNGNLEVYLVDDSQSLWGIGQTAVVSAPALPAWSGWQAFEVDSYLPPALGSLAAGRNLDGREELFAIDSSGVVWHAYNPPGGPAGGTANIGLMAMWTPTHFVQVGGGVLANVQLVSNADGRLELFGVGTGSGRLCHIWESQPNSDVFAGAPTAIVLGGGGTVCDFQVGALRFLHDNAGIQSGILCGTSLGALNAAKFAERNLDQLQEFWLSLAFPDDLFQEEPWFQPTAGGGPHGNAWLVDSIEQEHFEPVSVPSSASALLNPATMVGNIGKGIGVFAKIAAAATDATLSALGSGLGYVSFVLGLISFVMQLQSDLLPGDNKVNDIVNFYDGLLVNSSVYRLTPFVQKIGAGGALGGIDGNAITANSSQLMIGLTGVDDGGQYFVTESGATGNLIPFGLGAGLSGPVDLVAACAASAALPPFSPPLSLGDGAPTEEFFDGSICDAVPLDAALSQGAGQIFAIVPCSPAPSQLPANFFTTTSPSQYGGVIGIQSRTNDLCSHVIQDFSGGLDPALVTMIQPTFTPHNHWAVDPGFISISMAYGYMRAAETVNGNSALSPISDQIVQLRFQIWALENSINAQNMDDAQQGHMGFRAQVVPGNLVAVNDGSNLPRIRDLKNQLRGLVCQYLQGGGILPGVDFRSANELSTLGAQVAPFNATDFKAWWVQWERHVYPPQPGSPTPWHQFIDGSGLVWPAMPVSVVTAMADPCAPVTLPPTPTPS